MYRATGQTEKFGDMLKTMVVAQSRMDFYKEYKDFVPKQQWKGAVPQVQCRICQDVRGISGWCNGHKLYYYNHYNAEKKRNDIEIDFWIGTGNKLRQKIIPIEVKFGRNYLYPCLYGYVLVVFFFLIFLLVILINPIFLLNCI